MASFSLGSGLTIPNTGLSIGSKLSLSGGLSFEGFNQVVQVSATWDPARTNSHVVLSGLNLIATAGAASVNMPVFGTGIISTGKKKYWEVTVTTNGSQANTFAVGVGNALASTGDNEFLGIDANSITLYDSGLVYYNAGGVTTIAPFVQGNVVCVAVDFMAGLIWWRVNGGNWNNSAAANPATGAGGIALSVSGTLTPGLGLYYNGTTQDVGTGNFGASTAFTVPVGFTTFAVP